MNKKWNRRLLFATFGICSILPLQIFAQDNQSEDLPFGHGGKQITTWIRSDSHGRPSSIGVTIPAERIEMPPEQSYEIVLPFPRRHHIPFTHLYFLWEAHGHEPPGIYDIPHFDVHFYLIPDKERRQITCSGADEATCLKQPVPDRLPPDYAPGPTGVPMMGWHWVDVLSPEFHGQRFTSTFVYGYYDGSLAFFEPMIAKDFFETHPQMAAEIRLPQQFPKSGYYPTAYRVNYRSVSDSYEVALTGLKYQKGSR